MKHMLKDFSDRPRAYLAYKLGMFRTTLHIAEIMDLDNVLSIDM